MELKLANEHRCYALLQKFLHDYQHKIPRKPAPPEGSMIRCDCGTVFRYDKDIRNESYWQEVDKSCWS